MKKLYCIDPQHGHLVTWLQTKNTSFSPNELSAGGSCSQSIKALKKFEEWNIRSVKLLRFHQDNIKNGLGSDKIGKIVLSV